METPFPYVYMNLLCVWPNQIENSPLDCVPRWKSKAVVIPVVDAGLFTCHIPSNKRVQLHPIRWRLSLRLYSNPPFYSLFAPPSHPPWSYTHTGPGDSAAAPTSPTRDVEHRFPMGLLRTTVFFFVPYETVYSLVQLILSTRLDAFVKNSTVD